jgi:endoglucanase
MLTDGGMRLDVKAILEELTMLPGVSGHEAGISEAIARHFTLLGAEVRTDRVGNLIGRKNGHGDEPRPSVMLAAHMDEIGLMITRIEDEGFLRFTSVGGVDPRVLPGQEVVVHGSGAILGVIGAKPPHLQEQGERKKAYPMEDLYIDIGHCGEAAKRLVNVGDVVTIQRPFLRLSGEVVAGKALDDRAGVVALLACLDELRGLHHLADVFVVATVQEEVGGGLRGAMAATYGIVPGIGVAVDVTFGEDIEGVARVELGKGPAVATGPHVHPRLYERFVETAKDRNIPYQPEPFPSPKGTDAFAIQVARAGVPSALLGVPLRNMHTSVEVANADDIRKTGRLLASFIQSVDREFMEGLLCF